MATPIPPSIDSLLHGKALRALADKARYLAQLQQKLEPLLWADMSGHCRLGDFAAGVLTLITDSPAFATKARYLQPDLQRKLLALPEFKELRKIAIKVSPIRITPTLTTSATPLSPHSAHMLEEVALQCTDEKLKQALLRLSGHTQTRK